MLYYYRALRLNPNDGRAKRNLQEALHKLNIPNPPPETVFSQIFSFHYRLSLPERLRLFFIFAFLAVILASFYIWMERAWFRRVAVLFALLATVFLASIGYTRYLTPLEGVIVKSTFLYRDAGAQYAKVLNEPILSGNKVTVLDVLQHGTWLKISTPDGILGYVPQESIRVI